MYLFASKSHQRHAACACFRNVSEAFSNGASVPSRCTTECKPNEARREVGVATTSRVRVSPDKSLGQTRHGRCSVSEMGRSRRIPRDGPRALKILAHADFSWPNWQALLARSKCASSSFSLGWVGGDAFVCGWRVCVSFFFLAQRLSLSFVASCRCVERAMACQADSWMKGCVSGPSSVCGHINFRRTSHLPRLLLHSISIPYVEIFFLLDALQSECQGRRCQGRCFVLDDRFVVSSQKTTHEV